jgi:hypothetical protein
MRSPFSLEGRSTMLSPVQVRKRIEARLNGRMARRSFERLIALGQFPAPTEKIRRGFKGSLRVWAPDAVETGIASLLSRLRDPAHPGELLRLGHGSKHRMLLAEIGRAAWDACRYGVAGPDLARSLRDAGLDVPLRHMPRDRRQAALTVLVGSLGRNVPALKGW